VICISRRREPVAARIADVAEQQPVLPEHRHDERRAHAGVLRIGVRGVEDRAVGVVDADVHRAAHVVSVADSDALRSQRPSSVLMNEVHMLLATSPAL
jgi:hypothetical protein